MDHLDPIPPQALDMEAQVLGAMLLDPAAADQAVAILAPEDFYKGAHREIFRAARQILVETKGLDQALLRQKLADAGRLEEVGGNLYLGELAAGVGSSAHVDQYARQVKERSLLRRVIAVSTELARDGHEPGRSPGQLLASARSRLEELERSTAVGLDTMAPRMSSAFPRLEELKAGPPSWLLKPQGFDALLELLPGGGLWPGLYVLGGPPMVGKTTFIMQLLEATMASTPSINALYVSGEMTEDDLLRSCVCRDADLDQTAVLRGHLDAGEWERYDRSLVACSERLHNVRCIRDLNVANIRLLARQLRPAMVVIDFLQLLQPDGDFSQAKDRIDAVARELMLMRDELRNVPIFVLASHNRGEAKKPYAPGRGYGAYKETGNIEYCADRCFNLEFTEDEYAKSRTGELGKVIELNLVVIKNRLGSPGRVGIQFLGSRQRFLVGEGTMYGAYQHGGKANGR